METKPYCIPLCAGIFSEPHPVGRRIAKLLDALDTINGFVVDPNCGIRQDVSVFFNQIVTGLRSAGWRVHVKRNDKWSVLPPKERKNP